MKVQGGANKLLQNLGKSLSSTREHIQEDNILQDSQIYLLYRPQTDTRTRNISIFSYNKSQRDALFLKFILIKNFACFGQIQFPSSGVSTPYRQARGICHAEILKDGIKNKFEKECISLTFVIRIYYDARSSECQKHIITCKKFMFTEL